jgi:hypothetical protein
VLPEKGWTQVIRLATLHDVSEGNDGEDQESRRAGAEQGERPHDSVPRLGRHIVLQSLADVVAEF